MVAGSVHRSGLICGQCRPLARPFAPAAAAAGRGYVARSNAVANADVAPASASAPAAPATGEAAKAPSFKANLDFKFVKDNLQLVIDNCKERLSNADPARVVALYDEFTRLKTETDALRASRNENSSAMKVRGAPGTTVLNWNSSPVAMPPT